MVQLYCKQAVWTETHTSRLINGRVFEHLGIAAQKSRFFIYNPISIQTSFRENSNGK